MIGAVVLVVIILIAYYLLKLRNKSKSVNDIDVENSVELYIGIKNKSDLTTEMFDARLDETARQSLIRYYSDMGAKKGVASASVDVDESNKEMTSGVNPMDKVNSL